MGWLRWRLPSAVIAHLCLSHGRAPSLTRDVTGTNGDTGTSNRLDLHTCTRGSNTRRILATPSEHTVFAEGEGQAHVDMGVFSSLRSTAATFTKSVSWPPTAYYMRYGGSRGCDPVNIAAHHVYRLHIEEVVG